MPINEADDGDVIDKIETELSVCESENVKLSQWEREFVISIRDQFDRLGYLSEKQKFTLHTIYDKVV